jgi:hypothetical protein
MTHSNFASEGIADYTEKNIELAGQLLEKILADPDILDEIPENAMIVVIPNDDAELTAHNLAMAEQWLERKQEVLLYPIGKRQPESDRWQAAHHRFVKYRRREPHLPDSVAPEAGDLKIVYDRDRDVLFVDFFGGRRSAIGAPASDLIAYRIDPDSGEIIGFLVAGFLESIVQRSPQLTTTLRAAEMRSITDEELGGLQPPNTLTAGGTATDQENARELFNVLVNLLTSRSQHLVPQV